MNKSMSIVICLLIVSLFIGEYAYERTIQTIVLALVNDIGLAIAAVILIYSTVWTLHMCGITPQDIYPFNVIALLMGVVPVSVSITSSYNVFVLLCISTLCFSLCGLLNEKAEQLFYRYMSSVTVRGHCYVQGLDLFQPFFDV